MAQKQIETGQALNDAICCLSVFFSQASIYSIVYRTVYSHPPYPTPHRFRRAQLTFDAHRRHRLPHNQHCRAPLARSLASASASLHLTPFPVPSTTTQTPFRITEAKGPARAAGTPPFGFTPPPRSFPRGVCVYYNLRDRGRGGRGWGATKTKNK